MFADEHVQLAEHVLVPPEREIAVDPVHQRRQPQLVELCHLVTPVRLEQQPGEGRAAPERERFAQELGSRFELARSCALAGGRKELPHARDVELVGADPEPVATVCRRDRVATVPGQHLPQLGDVDVDRLSGRGRRRLAPELVDQALARDELVRMQEQDRQDEPLLQPAQRDRLALVDHLERPEDPVLHEHVLPLPKPERKSRSPLRLSDCARRLTPAGDSRGMARPQHEEGMR